MRDFKLELQSWLYLMNRQLEPQLLITHPVRVSALHGCCIQRSTAFPSSFCKVIDRILEKDMTKVCRTVKAMFRIRDIFLRIRIHTTDLWIRIRILICILLFTSVTFEMPTKNIFFLKFFCLLFFEGTFTSFLMKDKKSFRSQKQKKSRIFLLFCLRIRIRPD